MHTHITSGTYVSRKDLVQAVVMCDLSGGVRDE
jgi:hypothetical protein